MFFSFLTRMAFQITPRFLSGFWSPLFIFYSQSTLSRSINQNCSSRVCLLCLLNLHITIRKYTQGWSFPMNFLRRFAFQILISCQRSIETRLAGILLLCAGVFILLAENRYLISFFSVEQLKHLQSG